MEEKDMGFAAAWNDGFTLAEFLEFFPSVAQADAEEFLSILDDRPA